MNFFGNLTTTVEVLASKEKSAYTFFQIGMIYRVEGLRPLKIGQEGEFQHFWVDAKDLKEEECSKLLWQFILTSF